MIKDVINVGEDKILKDFSRKDIESLMKQLEIEDIYSIDISKNRQDIIKLIEVLGVTLVALKGQNSLLQERLAISMTNNKNK